jgi:hypothetical protein
LCKHCRYECRCDSGSCRSSSDEQHGGALARDAQGANIRNLTSFGR